MDLSEWFRQLIQRTMIADFRTIRAAQLEQLAQFNERSWQETCDTVRNTITSPLLTHNFANYLSLNG